MIPFKDVSEDTRERALLAIHVQSACHFLVDLIQRDFVPLDSVHELVNYIDVWFGEQSKFDPRDHSHHE